MFQASVSTNKGLHRKDAATACWLHRSESLEVVVGILHPEREDKAENFWA